MKLNSKRRIIRSGRKVFVVVKSKETTLFPRGKDNVYEAKFESSRWIEKYLSPILYP